MHYYFIKNGDEIVGFTKSPYVLTEENLIEVSYLEWLEYTGQPEYEPTVTPDDLDYESRLTELEQAFDILAKGILGEE